MVAGSVRLWVALLVGGILTGSPRAGAAPHPEGATVVWISLDGVRADYLDRAPLPFFERLGREGAVSRRLRPVFPPITFPSHASQATGVSVERHGITGNDFYDTGARREFRYPGDASLLQAEPIWQTAARQGVRVAVLDWPLSYQQTGPARADYFSPKFDNTLTDDARLNRLLDLWRRDPAARPGTSPLRLLMGYVHATDGVGHRLGPDAPEIASAMEALDRTLARFCEEALALWSDRHPASGAAGAPGLYFLFTTDHGMSRVHTLVNLNKLLGLSTPAVDGSSVEGAPMTITTGNIGHVFLPADLPASARDGALAQLEETARKHPFLQVFRRADLPTAWGYRHPTRTGDLVVVLNAGHCFDRRIPGVTAEATPGLLGMHGYPPEDNPEMLGIALLWRATPTPLGAKDLGEVNWDQLHPTVARLLGIEPAEGAKGDAILIP